MSLGLERPLLHVHSKGQESYFYNSLYCLNNGPFQSFNLLIRNQIKVHNEDAGSMETKRHEWCVTLPPVDHKSIYFTTHITSGQKK